MTEAQIKYELTKLSQLFPNEFVSITCDYSINDGMMWTEYYICYPDPDGLMGLGGARFDNFGDVQRFIWGLSQDPFKEIERYANEHSED